MRRSRREVEEKKKRTNSHIKLKEWLRVRKFNKRLWPPNYLYYNNQFKYFNVNFFSLYIFFQLAFLPALVTIVIFRPHLAIVIWLWEIVHIVSCFFVFFSSLYSGWLFCDGCQWLNQINWLLQSIRKLLLHLPIAFIHSFNHSLMDIFSLFHWSKWEIQFLVVILCCAVRGCAVGSFWIWIRHAIIFMFHLTHYRIILQIGRVFFSSFREAGVIELPKLAKHKYVTQTERCVWKRKTNYNRFGLRLLQRSGRNGDGSHERTVFQMWLIIYE